MEIKAKRGARKPALQTLSGAEAGSDLRNVCLSQCESMPTTPEVATDNKNPRASHRHSDQGWQGTLEETYGGFQGRTLSPSPKSLLLPCIPWLTCALVWCAGLTTDTARPLFLFLHPYHDPRTLLPPCSKVRNQCLLFIAVPM